MSGVLADIGIGPISIPTPGDLVTALKDAVVDVATSVFEQILEWIAGLLADAVAKVTEALVTLLRAIKPTLTPGGTIEPAAAIQQQVLGLAAALLVAFYLFRIIHGLLTGQAGQNMRATIVDLPMVVVGTLFFGFLCYTLLTLIDAFSDPMIDGFATTLNDTVTTLYSKEGLVKGGLFVFIFALLYIAGAIFLCLELFVRSSLIYLVVMFAPLALATRMWGPTKSYARKATETAVALIFSKLAIAVTLATGASLMNAAATDGGTVEMIQGSAILLLAAFMPFALMRVIPIMEGAVSAEGVGRGMGAKAAVAGYGATKAAGAISNTASNATQSLRSAWEGRQSGGNAGSGREGGSAGGGSASGGSSPSATATKPKGPSGGVAPGGAASPSSPGSGSPPDSSQTSTATVARETVNGLARSAEGSPRAMGRPAATGGQSSTTASGTAPSTAPNRSATQRESQTQRPSMRDAQPPPQKQIQPKPAKPRHDQHRRQPNEGPK